jgi:mRNA-degrading endonuclease RelE of RelBE toxin-antitoxin system
MKVRMSGRAAREYESLSPALQRRAARQFAYLAGNLRHPSLNAKKYHEARDLWQGRITREYRFYFSIEGETYWILAITKHPK